MALAPIDFHAQEIPGLRIESASALVENTALNVLHADLDGDGALDLIFPRDVSFQRDGLFPRDARTPLPAFSSRPLLDTWGQDIYLRFGDRLTVIRWKDAGWQTMLDQAISWPPADNAVAASALLQGSMGPSAWFARFLHDLDGDGTPEILVTSPDGIHVYSRNADLFRENGILNVLPPLACSVSARPRLWPAARRVLEFPVQAMQCRLIIEGSQIGVITSEETRGGRARYRLEYRAVARGESGDFHVVEPDEGEDARFSEWLPAHFAPCRLNGDGMLDMVGGSWTKTTATAVPAPVYAVEVSLDGGKTLREYRSIVFRPGPSFLDFDGDGDLDLVVESSEFFDGGARETLARFLTRPAIDHSLRVYPQAAGAFAERPLLFHRMTLQVETPPLLESAAYQRYRRGALVSLAGDFNGDRYRDLLVQDKPGRLAVFLAAGYSFSDTPDAIVAAEPNCLMGAADVNGDGRSDIVIRWTPAQAAKNVERCRVYFARETAR